jgi:hypothetical protein
MPLTLLFVAATVGYCREAKVIVLTPSGAQSIDPKKDHYSILFLSGWVSKHDGVMARIFQNAKKLTAEADGTSHFFDGEDIPKAWVFNNTDVGHDLDRPWAGAAQKPVVDDYPADTSSKVTIQANFYSDDRFSQLIQAFQASEPTGGIDAEPYITYAKLADSLFITLFGTDRTVYPFIMEFNVTPTDAPFSEQYFVGIAPTSDTGDTLISNILSDPTKLSYNEASNSLTFNGRPIQDHTWAVFKVAKAGAVDICVLTLVSKAPWAVLAVSNFIFPAIPAIASASDAAKQDSATVAQLSTELSLLKSELRFSAFDRATALKTFAISVRNAIANACSVGGVSNADCRTPKIDNFMGTLFQLFPELTPAVHAEADSAAAKVANGIRYLLQSNAVDNIEKLASLIKENRLRLQ